MRVRTKFVSITLFVAVIPLLMSASQSLRVHEKTLNDILVQLHATSADLGAQAVHQHLDHIENALQNTVQGTIDWDALTATERHAALQLIIGQIPDAALVTLDRPGGVSVHTSRPDGDTKTQFEPDDIGRFRGVLPPPQGGEVVLGRPLQLKNGQTVLPLSVNDWNQAGQLTASVGVALSLQRLCETLERAIPAQGSVFLLDERHELLCEDGHTTRLTVADASLARAVATGSSGYSRTASPGELRGAVARANGTLHVVVEQPMALLSAPTRALRRQVALWLLIGASAAVISGIILGRSILIPLERLALATTKIGSGVFTEPIEKQDFDAEFADLATSFNTMASAIAERDDEIRTWNRELQNRIEERSRELETAQDALLGSRKMAGLSVTTAGVAHELNNPLTGVLGLAQVLMARLRKRDEESQNVHILQSIVGESKRMQALLERMKVLHSDPERSSFREVNCANLLEGALIVRKRDFDELGSIVVKEFPESPVYVWGHLERLHMVFVELTENAFRSVRESQPSGHGRLTVTVRAKSEDWVEITVEDNGAGIRPDDRSRVFEPFFTTKPGGIGQGLGLSQVYRMVEAHAGKVWVDSSLESGCRIVVRLPRARVGAHLS